LTNTPILAYPRNEDSFILDTDASNTCMGAVLSQIQDGKEKVIAYYSKAFSRTERKYCVTRRELLAVVASIKHFHHYLYGRHFLLRSDHGALRWLLNSKNPEGQIGRWFEILAAYDFDIEHRTGRSHANTDATSRRPCHKENCSHCSRTEQKCQLEMESGDKSSGNSDININDNMGDNPTYVDQMLIEENVVAYVPTRSGKRLDKSPSMSNHEAIERENDPSKLDSDSSFDLTAEKLIEYQKNDMDLNFLISWKEKGEKSVWETVSPCSPAVRYQWSRWDTLYLKAGILYRKWENADGHGEKLLVVLPQTLIKFVLM
jgi:hypothetical protein